MGRYDFGDERRLWRAVAVQTHGPDDVDLLEYLARTSRACDHRRPSKRLIEVGHVR